MEDESKVNTLLLANNDEVVSSFRRALSSSSNLSTSSSTQGALDILKEALELYHLRTDLDRKVSDYNEQLLQVELNLESLIEDIEASHQINTNVKFDYITRLKSTITLLGTPSS